MINIFVPLMILAAISMMLHCKPNSPGKALWSRRGTGGGGGTQRHHRHPTWWRGGGAAEPAPPTARALRPKIASSNDPCRDLSSLVPIQSRRQQHGTFRQKEPGIRNPEHQTLRIHSLLCLFPNRDDRAVRVPTLRDRSPVLNQYSVQKKAKN